MFQFNDAVSNHLHRNYYKFFIRKHLFSSRIHTLRTIPLLTGLSFTGLRVISCHRQSCAGPDRFADSRKMSAYSAISRLVHQNKFLPIEFVCLLICGSTMKANVRDSYYDPSWEHRHTAYDTMSPDDVRAAARAARQYQREHGTDDVVYKAFTLIAAEESEEYANLMVGLRGAAESSRQQRLDALEDDYEPRPHGVSDPHRTC
jgi:hypothetical protein